MYTITPVGAALGGEAYLITTPQKTALIDSGFAYCAGELIKNLENALSGRELDYIILTHTHYDHCSGCAYCLDRWKNAKVIAGTYSAKVFSRPGALNTIRLMNLAAAQERGCELKNPEQLEKLRVDIPVSQGDIIDLGELKFTVIQTPGHTKCSISLYSPQEKLLVASESLGLYTGIKDFVIPCFLVGYEMSIQSIKKVMPLDIQSILFPHLGLKSGEEIQGFFSQSLYWFEKTRDAIVQGYREGKDGNELMDILSGMFYTGKARKMQPEKAFLLNAGYMVQIVIRECLGISDYTISHQV